MSSNQVVILVVAFFVAVAAIQVSENIGSGACIRIEAPDDRR